MLVRKSGLHLACPVSLLALPYDFVCDQIRDQLEARKTKNARKCERFRFINGSPSGIRSPSKRSWPFRLATEKSDEIRVFAPTKTWPVRVDSILAGPVCCTTVARDDSPLGIGEAP
jgi:hypothetical protein